MKKLFTISLNIFLRLHIYEAIAAIFWHSASFFFFCECYFEVLVCLNGCLTALDGVDRNYLGSVGHFRLGDFPLDWFFLWRFLLFVLKNSMNLQSPRVLIGCPVLLEL